MDLTGCGTALVTPFRRDGAVDEAALRAHVAWQVESGIELLVPAGTTGEASTLTETEWLRVIEITVEAAAGRALVFGGCTHNATAEAVARAKKLAAVQGLSGLLTANPYYNRPSQEGQYQHFRAIAQATDLPVLLYNIPGRTGANLEPATVLRLARDAQNIVGIKESSGNMGQITELLTRLAGEAPKGFKVFAGDDGVVLPVMALGGAGLISVSSNIIPSEMGEMVRAAGSEDWARARTLNARWFPLMQALFTEPNPAPVKAMLAIMGRGEDVLRLPMVPVSEAARGRLERLGTELGLVRRAIASQPV